MTETLLVPSAGLVPKEMRLDLGDLPTALIPLDGKPVLRHINAQYEMFSHIKKYIAINERTQQVQQYLKAADIPWETVDVGGTEKLGKTIYNALDTIRKDRPLTVNLGDTLFTPIKSGEKDVIGYAYVADSSRWTRMQIEGNELVGFDPKFQHRTTGKEPIFTGYFHLKDPKAFHSRLKDNSRDFYPALLNYLNGREHQLLEAENWTDVGHLDTFHQARKESIAVREFNSIDISHRFDILRKQSDDQMTLQQEANWYRNIPKDLQPLLPRIYDTGPRMIEMEYVSYPSIAELYLYGAHNPYVWQNIFKNLFDLHDTFRNFQPEGEDGDAIREMYVQKTVNRLQEFRSQGFNELFETDGLTVNGQEVPSPRQIIEQIDQLVEQHLTGTSFSIIHGDPCFSNILYDLRQDSIKLIDPRGSFGSYTIHGDPRYDLAKMRHSAVGKYDFIINDLFEATYKDKNIEYDIHTLEQHEKREERFETMLKERYSSEYDEIRLIESLLFLSMVPLHSDSEEHQIGMLGTGLDKIREFW